MSALYHLMAHRRVASVHMQHGTPHRSGISSITRPDVPLVSLRDAPAEGDNGGGEPKATPEPHATPWWYRAILPLAIVASAVMQIAVIGAMFGWWK